MFWCTNIYFVIFFQVISRFFADKTSVELKRTLTPVSPRANRLNKLFVKSNSKTYCFNFFYVTYRTLPLILRKCNGETI
uniref:Putative secreted protein n=1 Tax=Ixodes scapularis TaxID=6945 RepID=A0A4D5S540_IXOSC